ncbi:MAG: hypothetical protein HY081_08330 [Gammaproteobacteria bacterium]|nr:hypothetical protein [Gammaproteobacteria bacterium]
MTRIIYLSFICIFLVACATPEVEILSQTESFAPTHHVEVLLDMPSRPYKTFAILEDNYGGSPEEINARLEQKGRDIGADAIVIVSVNDKTVTDWIAANPYSVHGAYRLHYRPIKHVYHAVRARALKYSR